MQSFAVILQKPYMDLCDTVSVTASLRNVSRFLQAHTDKPAVIALLHDADEISLLQLQLVFVLRRVTVQRLETGVGCKDELVNLPSLEETKCETSE